MTRHLEILKSWNWTNWNNLLAFWNSNLSFKKNGSILRLCFIRWFTKDWSSCAGHKIYNYWLTTIDKCVFENWNTCTLFLLISDVTAESLSRCTAVFAWNILYIPLCNIISQVMNLSHFSKDNFSKCYYLCFFNGSTVLIVDLSYKHLPFSSNFTETNTINEVSQVFKLLFYLLSKETYLWLKFEKHKSSNLFLSVPYFLTPITS